jgi:hypothetical protein
MLQAMNRLRLELPPHNGGHLAAPTRDPGLHQQARRIDLQIFAFHAERRTIRAHAEAPIFAARAEISVPLRDAIQAFLSPPLRRLRGIGNRLEDTLRWRGNEDFRNYRILIGSDFNRSHEASFISSRQIS